MQSISKEEVRAASKKLKSGKTAGSGDMSVEDSGLFNRYTDIQMQRL